MNTLLLASNNEHKFREMTSILKHLDAPVHLMRPSDLGFSFDVVESGDTFEKNAAAKAWGLYRLLLGEQLPGVTASDTPGKIRENVRSRFSAALPKVIADDSGICVHALDNAPGVYSARFGSDGPDPPRTDEERNTLLLKTLTGVSDRGAHYVCNAVLVLDSEQYIQTEATWHGTVLSAPAQGTTGFGYDPLIFLEDYGLSVAQMPQEQKDHVSHRAKAVAALMRGAALS